MIGQEIVEDEQRGQRRAEYGRRLLEGLATRLTREYGCGYSARNLWFMRQFYLAYPGNGPSRIVNALRSQSAPVRDVAVAESRPVRWKPGRIHPNLGWTHYRALIKIESPKARDFYEIEAVRNAWSGRELERQIASLLFERMAMSRDRKGLQRLATRGQVIQKAADVFKDPVIIEFLGLPESPRLAESTLETALINNLQAFLLELGSGFAFVARQQRITLDGDHFYIDLVFYHSVLKCFVVIDLKVGALEHKDLGQLQLYVNWFDEHRRTAGDGPTLGLILCTDKNEAVVRYTLGPGQEKRIFASRYKLHLPTVRELADELQREVEAIGWKPPRGHRR